MKHLLGTDLSQRETQSLKDGEPPAGACSAFSCGTSDSLFHFFLKTQLKN